MDKEVLNLAKDKKIADFADVVKQELKKKVLDDEYIKSKATELETYQNVSKTLSDIKKDDEVTNPETKEENPKSETEGDEPISTENPDDTKSAERSKTPKADDDSNKADSTDGDKTDDEQKDNPETKE